MRRLMLVALLALSGCPFAFILTPPANPDVSQRPTCSHLHRTARRKKAADARHRRRSRALSRKQEPTRSLAGRRAL